MNRTDPTPKQLDVIFWVYLIIAFFMSMGMNRALHIHEDFLATLFGLGSFVFSFAAVFTYSLLKPEK